MRGLRIGFVRHFHERDMPADPEVAAALEHVARTLAAEGAEIRDVTLPPLAEFAAVNRVILSSEAWSVHAPWLRHRPGDYGRLARRRLMAGAFYRPATTSARSAGAAQLIAAVEEALRDGGCAAVRQLDGPGLPHRRRRGGGAHLSAPGAHAVQRHRPSGAGDDGGPVGGGLPLSVQFAGRYFDEATVLRVARAWERAAGTDAAHPALADPAPAHPAPAHPALG